MRQYYIWPKWPDLPPDSLQLERLPGPLPRATRSPFHLVRSAFTHRQGQWIF